MAIVSDMKRGVARRREPKRFGLVFCMVFSLVMIVFSLYGAQASVFERARATVLDMFEPVLSVLAAPVRWVDGQVGHVEDYFRVRAENERLRAENEALRQWMNEAYILRQRVAYYENIVDSHHPEAASYIDGEVIGENAGPYDRALIFSAGRKDGVTEGAAVIDASGLLGHIVDAGQSASRILLLTHSSSRVPVVIEELGVEAVLSGRSRSEPVLEFYSERADLQPKPGMRIVTSGAGGLLPRGIAVGEIARLTEESATVRLFADHRSPDLVRVVNFSFPRDVETDEAALTSQVALEETERDG